MEQDKQKKPINKKYLILIIAILVIITLTTTSYALFKANIIGGKISSVGTDKFELHFKEGNELNITSMYQKDEEALEKVDYFEFTIEGKYQKESNLDYLIYLEEVTKDAIIENVKINLTKLVNNEEQVVLQTTNIDELNKEENNYLLYSETMAFKKENYNPKDTYRLRSWINEQNIDLGTLDKDGPIIIEPKSYKFKINVKINEGLKEFQTLNSIILKDNLSKTTETTNGKESLYYVGNVDNNYVSFANMIWRIVRINEDGTIRLILQDGINNNKMYAYKQTNNTDINATYYTNSDAKKELESWYDTNLKTFDAKIAKGIYCEQLKVIYDKSIPVGSATVVLKDNYTPSFNCTTDGNNHGILSLKIGLLSIDEMLMSGIKFIPTESESYLKSNNNYWLGSPAGAANSNWTISMTWSYVANKYAHMKYVSQEDAIYRPVINLVSDIKVSNGKGTITSPYVIA